MKLLLTTIFCAALFFISGCSRKKSFTEANFEATIEKAHKEKDPELILSYLNSTASIPEVYKANAFNQIALVYVKTRDNSPQAILYFKKAIAAVDNKVSYQAALIRGVALFELAKIHMNNKDYKSARDDYVNLIKNHQQFPGLKLNCMRIYQEIAFIDACMQDYKSERKIFIKILNIQESNSKYNSEDIATTYGLIAQSYNRSKDYVNSVKCSKKAIKYLYKVDADKYVSGMIYYTYAISLYNNMQRQDAVKQLKIACDFFSKSKFPSSNAKLEHSLQLLTKWQKDDGS